MIYQNFDLEIISPHGGDRLCVRVLESPRGACPFIDLKWPFDADEENALLSEIYGGLRQRHGRSRQAGIVQDVGGRLFEAVFAGDIEHLFRSSLDIASRSGNGLRLRLRLPEDSTLHGMPWEFLFDTESRAFLSVQEHTPVVRYLPVAQPIPPVTVEGPLRLLVALSSPTDHPRLDIAREWDILLNALKPLIASGQLELRRVPGRCTFDTLRDSLRHYRADIFHFVGHGIPGALVLEQEGGGGIEMAASQLHGVFPLGALPGLIVLNACSGAIAQPVPFAGLAQGFLRQKVPAVVAKQASITEDAALIFTRYFYRELVESGAVDTSLTEARLRMQVNGHPIEWGTPVLYMRALSGHLFQPAVAPAGKRLADLPASLAGPIPSPAASAGTDRPREIPPQARAPAARTEPNLNEARKAEARRARHAPPPKLEPDPAERKKPRTARARENAPRPGLEPVLDIPPFPPEAQEKRGPPAMRPEAPLTGADPLQVPAPETRRESEEHGFLSEVYGYLRQGLRFFKKDRTPAPALPSRALDPAGPAATADVRAATEVACQILAEMDQQILLNRTSTIEVIISRELVECAPEFASDRASAAIDPTRKLLVQVVPKSNLVLAAPQADRVEIDPPLPNEQKSVYFDVKGAYPGQGEVWIIVRQRQTGIARLVLEPKVVERAEWSPLYRAKAEASAAEAPVLAGPFDQLLVIEQTIGDKVQYIFELDMPSVNVFEQHTSKPLQLKREAYVKALYRGIEERYLSHYNEATRTADVEAFSAELQAYGVSLFEELFPKEVQAQLWTHRSKLTSIRVVSTEPFIPWEIVHLKAPGEPLDPDAPTLFLGQLGLVRWLHNVNGHAPVQLRVRAGRARYVIPDYPHPDWALFATAAERAFLERTFAATAVQPQPNEVRRLLSHAGAFDLLHFACHGEAHQDEVGYARIFLEGRIEGAAYKPSWLDASTVEAFARLRGQDGTQPIVFLNACQAGRAGYKLTGIGGFAQAFLRAGAGAFVGTLWSVEDEPAFSFGKAFYEALLSGGSMPEATKAAREAARQTGDATWLAYVVYAHPHARLVRGGSTS